MNYSQKEQKFINSLQVLEFLFKLQKLRFCPEITIFDGDFIIQLMMEHLTISRKEWIMKKQDLDLNTDGDA